MTSVPLLWRACPPCVREDPAVRAIAAHVADPAVRQRLRQGQAARQYPAEVLEELRACGLCRLFGPEATPWHWGILEAELAAADGSLAITVGVHGLALLPVHLDGSEALRRRVFERVEAGEMSALLLTEWDHGSDLLANETAARAVGGGFEVHGSKALINGGQRHGLLNVLARTRDSRMNPGSVPGASFGDHTLFCLPRGPGVEVVERHDTLPTRGADISWVRVEGVRVEPDAIIGTLGDGFAVVRRTLSLSRGGVAALAAGATAAVHALARDHAHARVLYGRPILNLDAIADHLAELAELDAQCSALVARVTAFVNAFGLSAAPMTAIAKFAGPRLAERATDVARRVLGSRALLEDHDLARYVRDVPLYGIFDGTQHVMLEEIDFGLERVARGRRLDAASPWERCLQAWTATPRPFSAMRRDTTRLRPIDPHRLATELSQRASWSWASTLPVLARSMIELRRRLLAMEDPPQSLRFAVAEACARLDVAFACLELGDPSVGLPVPVAAEACSALEAGGARSALAVAQRLRAVVAAFEPSMPALDEAEAELLRQAHRLRRDLVDALRPAS